MILPKASAIFLAASIEGNAAEIYFTYSPYWYVRNNPVLRLDPTGDWDITVHLHNDREQYMGMAAEKWIKDNGF